MCSSSSTFRTFCITTYLLFYNLAIMSSRKIFLLHALPLWFQKILVSLYNYTSYIVLYLLFTYLPSETLSYLKLRKVIIHLSIPNIYFTAWYTIGTFECCNYTQVNITVMPWSFLASKFASHQLYSVEKNGTRASHINHCYSISLSKLCE